MHEILDPLLRHGVVGMYCAVPCTLTCACISAMHEGTQVGYSSLKNPVLTHFACELRFGRSCRMGFRVLHSLFRFERLIRDSSGKAAAITVVNDSFDLSTRLAALHSLRTLPLLSCLSTVGCPGHERVVCSAAKHRLSGHYFRQSSCVVSLCINTQCMQTPGPSLFTPGIPSLKKETHQ